MGDIIEKERKVSHMRLAERVEGKLEDTKFIKSQKLGSDVKIHFVPLIISLTQINWNGRIPLSFKVAVLTISVHQHYPTKTTSMAAPFFALSVCDINHTAQTWDGRTSLIPTRHKKSITISSSLYKKRSLK